MIIKAYLEDFAIKSDLWSEYLRLNGLGVDQYNPVNFHTYLDEKGLLRRITSYNICYIDYIETCLQKKTVLNTFSTKVISLFKAEFGIVLCKESLYCLLFPLFTQPQSFQKADYSLEITIEAIHKNLIFIDKTNGHMDEDTKILLKILNDQYGIPLLSKEDRDYYLQCLKAA